MSSLRSEAGESLIETLIAVAILGIAVVAILAGIVTGITLSVNHRAQTDGNALLLRAAEVLKSPTANPFVACAQSSDYNPTNGLTVPSGWTVTLTSVLFSDGAITSPDDGTEWKPRSGGGTPADTCLGQDQVAGTSDDEWKGSEHLQKLTLSVAGPGGVTRTLDVLKGNS